MGEIFETPMIVGALDCDALGHMNVAQYFALCNRNGFAMQEAMGWPAGAEIEGKKLSFAAVHAECDLVSEVLEGEKVLVRCHVVRIGTRSADFQHGIVRENGSVAFTSLWRSACLNLETRRAEEIPPLMRAALERFLVAA